MKRTLLTILLAIVLVTAKTALSHAGVPFNNLEGVGGVAFNPLAYLAEGDSDFKIANQDVIGKPRFGGWYVNLGKPKIDWTSFGVADTLFKRLEISYGYENAAWVGHPTFHKNNVGAKFLVLPENSFDSKFVPAFSVGTIYKDTSDKGLHQLGLALRGSGKTGMR